MSDRLGLIWMAGSVLAASAMTVAIRDLSGSVDSRAIVLWRAGLSVIGILAAAAVLPRLRQALRTSRLRDHAARAVAIGMSMQLGFFAIARIPLATATILFFTAPIWAALLAALLGRERAGPRRWAAIAAGFGGALILLRPGAALDVGMLAALASALLLALAHVWARGLADRDGPVVTYFWAVVATAALSLPLAWPVLGAPEDGRGWVALVVIVTFGGLRGVADIQAYRYGQAALLAPLSYTRLLLIGGAGWWLYAEHPDAATWLGAAVVTAAALAASRPETRKPPT